MPSWARSALHVLGIVGDAADALRRCSIGFQSGGIRSGGHGRPNCARRIRSGIRRLDESPLHPVNLIRAFARMLPSDAIVTTDVGQHQMWMAQRSRSPVRACFSPPADLAQWVSGCLQRSVPRWPHRDSAWRA
jgi:thiamine pyrophosphate-dependent acetolactate synthase large subunit-like protein